MVRMTHRPALIAALVAVGFVPANPAHAAPAACKRLPVSAKLLTDDPTQLRDDPRAVAFAVRGAQVNRLRLALVGRGRTYASGGLSGRLSTAGRTAVALKLKGQAVKGRYKLIASGQVVGCPKRSSISRDLDLRTPSLPVRAAPVSTLAGDNVGGLRLTVRSVSGERIASLRATLLDGSGGTVAEITRGGFAGATQVELPLSGQIKPGRYTLRLAGRAADSARRQESVQDLTFAGGGGGAAAPSTTAPPSGAIVQKAIVGWNGDPTGREAAGFNVPGIGYGEVVCRKDAQWIRIFPSNAGREVSMLNWTYKQWGSDLATQSEKALREAQHTQYTGLDFREGLNKFSPTEATSTGEYDGIISDRGVFGTAAPGDLAAPTLLKLTWIWDFTKSGAERCHAEATLTTPNNASVDSPVARGAQVMWRSNAGAAGHSDAGVDVPGLGRVSLYCEPSLEGRHVVIVDTPSGARITTREGSDDPSVEQAAGPLTANLPNNGQVAIDLPGGRHVLVSSRWKVNDPDQAQNFCAVAAVATVGA